LEVVAAFDAHAAELNELTLKRRKIAAKRGGGDFYAIT
jgi:hypothetical protein